MGKRITSIVLTTELYEILKERARVNKRSLSSEINYLIELGLSCGNEEIIKLLNLAAELE